MFTVKTYYQNPQRNETKNFETVEDALADGLRYECVVYVENTETGEWTKKEAGEDKSFDRWYQAVK